LFKDVTIGGVADQMKTISYTFFQPSDGAAEERGRLHEIIAMVAELPILSAESSIECPV